MSKPLPISMLAALSMLAAAPLSTAGVRRVRTRTALDEYRIRKAAEKRARKSAEKARRRNR